MFVFSVCLSLVFLASGRPDAGSTGLQTVHALDGQIAPDAFESGENGRDICHKWDWRKKALKLIQEMPVSGLFRDLKGHNKFEASGITRFNNQFVMVFDSLQELGFVDPVMHFMGPNNVLAGKAGEESSYEALTLRTRTNTLLAVIEAVQKEHWHAIVRELSVGEGHKLSPEGECLVEFALPEGASKGFEGAAYYDGGERGEFLLGLCEGNYCEGYNGRGQERGHGRLVVTKFNQSEDGSCRWTTEKVVHIPGAAHFMDYSDIDILGSRVAISSQEDSALWVGEIDWQTFEFVGDGEVLHFPRSLHCEPLYCNVEGVQWLDECASPCSA